MIRNYTTRHFSSIITSVIQVPYFYPILILQQWQHIFYFSTWDKSPAAKVSDIWYQFELMKWNFVVSRESYHGQVLIGTGADGISWILCSEPPLTCLSIWPTRNLRLELSVYHIRFLSWQFRYFLGSLLGTLAQISGGTAALILYYVIIQNTTGSVNKPASEEQQGEVCVSGLQLGPPLVTCLPGSWRECGHWLRSRSRRWPGWKIWAENRNLSL